MSPEVKWTVVATVAAAIIGGIFALISKWVPEKQPEIRPDEVQAEILNPRAGQVVGRSFVVEGTHGIIANEHHLWLAIEIGGLLWPKEPEVRTADRRWSVKIAEGGNPPGGVFSLVLFQVSDDGNSAVRKWIDSGHKNDDWPGIESNKLDGYSQLYVVRDLRLW